MKKWMMAALTAAAVLVSGMTASAVNWVRVTSSGGMTFYVDTDSIRSVGSDGSNRKIAWVKLGMLSGERLLSLVEIDYDNQTTTTYAFVMYDKEGNPQGTYTYKPYERPVEVTIPGSNGEKVDQFVLNYKN